MTEAERIRFVGVAIETAWNAHQDLPPIEMTEAEREYLARAAMRAVRMEAANMVDAYKVPGR
ncbi:hypothetical protein [Sphingomonas oryzagri]|uniref:Uncharacterized protein n=1 Tax=Sphingomonas oryzagri TaxID=3042314 RepID=A0ABT6N5T4_9SPHN|nr:hypothetical protein [Sphingomonas oryzagri]MDH7640463.1 hypothetical protein [Sphingomonas oryzagri]